VNTVRSGAADDQAINEYIRDISATVEEITEKTNTAVSESGNSALKKHAPPVIKVLEKSRIELNQERNSKDRLPPVAFRIARATKVWF
jgi:arginine decarboxylase-like protein